MLTHGRLTVVRTIARYPGSEYLNTLIAKLV